MSCRRRICRLAAVILISIIAGTVAASIAPVAAGPTSASQPADVALVRDPSFVADAAVTRVRLGRSSSASTRDVQDAPAQVTCEDTLQNGRFEDGPVVWALDTTLAPPDNALSRVIVRALDFDVEPMSGLWIARLGGRASVEDRLSQPSSRTGLVDATSIVSATVTFDLMFVTDEAPDGVADDTFALAFTSQDGQVLAVPGSSTSEEDLEAGYWYKVTMPVKQAMTRRAGWDSSRVVFVSRNDGDVPSTMLIDDVSLVVCQTGVPPSTAAPSVSPTRTTTPSATPGGTPGAGIRATAVITAFADADIIERYPDANSGDRLEMYVGVDGTLRPPGGIVRSLLEFDLAGLPPAAVISNASFSLHATGSYDPDGSNLLLAPYRVTSAWTEHTVTWNRAPAIAEAYRATSIAHGVDRWYQFDATTVVRAWADGSQPNYGLMLHSSEDAMGWRAFATHMTVSPPLLTVEYSYAPSYSVTVVPNSHVVSAQSPDAEAFVYVTSHGRFSDSIVLDVAGLPRGTTHEWAANPLTPSDRTILRITTSRTTPNGVFPVTITGTGSRSAHVRTSVLTLEVDNPQIYLPVTLRAGQVGLVTSTAGTDVSDPTGDRPAAPVSTVPVVARAALIAGVSDYEYMDPATPTTPTPTPVATRFALAAAVPIQFAPSAHGTASGVPGLIADVRAGAPGSDLNFSTIDARHLGDFLQRDGGLNVSSLRMLLGAYATKAGIHHGIVNVLDPQEGKDTIIVIFFSGHGMSAPDVDGDEADNEDEYIVTYEIAIDPTTGAFSVKQAISDDELAEWLSHLESERIVIIIDSCHSGGMVSMNAGAAVRGISRRPGSQTMSSDDAWRDGMIQDIQAPGRLVMMASRANESSVETSAFGNGVFTYYLLEAFRSPSADADGNGWISAEEAFAYLDPKVRKYTDDRQHPEMRDDIPGDVDLVTLAGTAVQPAPWPTDPPPPTPSD